ncbi:hypothetical protein SAMN03159353_11014 [Cedecea sp. NFIX57]|nr:hypothetical protein SAMN03159353_11014 [Cedecea sp. NFIX57]
MTGIEPADAPFSLVMDVSKKLLTKLITDKLGIN